MAALIALVVLAIVVAWFLWPQWTGCACPVPAVPSSLVTMAG